MQSLQNNSNQELEVEFKLTISSSEYLKYYQGKVKWVLARSTKGLKVRFPANLLSQFVTLNGINGRFILKYLSSGKLVSLSKIGES